MATVPTEVSELNFTGNGATVDFPLSFPILETSDLDVELTLDGETVPTVQVEGVDYNVSGAPSAAPIVTMVVAPPADSTLHVERNVPITQDINFVTNGPFSPASHTEAHDKRTMVEQQLARRLAALEALAALVSVAAFEAQLVEFNLATDAADVEDSFPFNVAVVAPVGQTITGVAIVRFTGELGDARAPVQMLIWDWAADVLTVGFITGLEPGKNYTFRILCTSMEP